MHARATRPHKKKAGTVLTTPADEIGEGSNDADAASSGQGTGLNSRGLKGSLGQRKRSLANPAELVSPY